MESPHCLAHPLGQHHQAQRAHAGRWLRLARLPRCGDGDVALGERQNPASVRLVRGDVLAQRLAA